MNRRVRLRSADESASLRSSDKVDLSAWPGVNEGALTGMRRETYLPFARQHNGLRRACVLSERQELGRHRCKRPLMAV